MNNGNVVKVRSKQAEMSVLSKSYLTLYNGFQSVGWGYLLFKTIDCLIKKQPLWPACSTNVMVFQTLAVLEILHCLIGLVPSSVIVTGVQIFSRVFMVWGILVPVEKAQNSPTLGCMFVAWGVTEVIRYLYYVTNLHNITPKILTWCRYTLFIGLYPAGVIGEGGNILSALETIKKTGLFSLPLPNKLNISFNFYYACLFVMASYIPLFPQLYLHMFRQRKKVMGSSKEKEPSKKIK